MAKSSKPAKPYAVGYKKPPAAHRFKPGHSGNPAGRPKGSRNLKSLFLQSAHREVSVTKGSQKVAITRVEAFFEVAWKNALSGDTKAWPLILSMLQQHLNDDADTSGDPELERDELELVQQLLSRASRGSDDPSTH